jgi:hypothetical protein
MERRRSLVQRTGSGDSSISEQAQERLGRFERTPLRSIFIPSGRPTHRFAVADWTLDRSRTYHFLAGRSNLAYGADAAGARGGGVHGRVAVRLRQSAPEPVFTRILVGVAAGRFDVVMAAA